MQRVVLEWLGVEHSLTGRGCFHRKDMKFLPSVLCSIAILIAPISKTLHAPLWSKGILLAGGAILGMALWLRHDNQTSKLLILQFENQPAPSTFYISVYILIAVGAVMMLVGFLGCYGAIQESQCLLGTFFFFLVILFACEVAAALWGFMNKDTVSKELINFYDAAYIKAMDVSDTSSKDSASKVLNVFHNALDCCGKGNDTLLFQNVAASLCSENTRNKPEKDKSCHLKLISLFSDKLYLIGLAALAVAVIMVFEMIFTMVLCCGIRNSPGVY